MHGDYIVVKIFEILHEQPVLFLFLLIGIGMAFGKVKIKGIGLGAAAVLFSPSSWRHGRSPSVLSCR